MIIFLILYIIVLLLWLNAAQSAARVANKCWHHEQLRGNAWAEEVAGERKKAQGAQSALEDCAAELVKANDALVVHREEQKSFAVLVRWIVNLRDRPRVTPPRRLPPHVLKIVARINPKQ
jgi:hypothetical protein